MDDELTPSMDGHVETAFEDRINGGLDLPESMGDPPEPKPAAPDGARSGDGTITPVIRRGRRGERSRC